MSVLLTKDMLCVIERTIRCYVVSRKCMCIIKKSVCTESDSYDVKIYFSTSVLEGNTCEVLSIEMLWVLSVLMLKYILCVFYNNCVCFVVKRYAVCITMSVMLSRELLFICLCDLIASLHPKFNISGCFLGEISTIKADFNVSCVLLKDTTQCQLF